MHSRTKHKNIYRNTKISGSQEGKFTISGIQRLSVYQEAGKRDWKVITTDLELTEMLELEGKGIKSFSKCIPYVHEARRKIEHVKQKQTKKKETQIELVGVKTAISKMKNTLDGINLPKKRLVNLNW